MGAFLSQPDTEKHSEGVTNGKLWVGVTGMQGWRRSMEDSHAAQLDLKLPGCHFFAVYDGHGGKEVARFCGRHLHRELAEHKDFRTDGDICAALGETFLRMDQKICGSSARRDMLAHDVSSSEDDNPPSPPSGGGGGGGNAASSVQEGDAAGKGIAGNDEEDEEEEEGGGDFADWEPHSGCTAVAVVVLNGQLHVANSVRTRVPTLDGW
jgi:protein phosphatase 1G